MRPDRIVVGEIRDAAALDMLQAMNTGHDGSISTLHANTPRDALSRLETMVMMSGMDLPVRAIREQVSSAVDLIIQQTRLKDGTRRITYVTEVAGMEGEITALQDFFAFDYGAGWDQDGARGTLRSRGLRPKFVDKLDNHGVKPDPRLLMLTARCDDPSYCSVGLPASLAAAAVVRPSSPLQPRGDLADDTRRSAASSTSKPAAEQTRISLGARAACADASPTLGVGPGHLRRQAARCHRQDLLRQGDGQADIDPHHRRQQEHTVVPPFEAAKAAALTYIDTAPDDVYIGLVTSSSDVDTVADPDSEPRRTAYRDRQPCTQSSKTALYDGVSGVLWSLPVTPAAAASCCCRMVRTAAKNRGRRT